MREEIKEEVCDEASGHPRAVITRNSSGSLVLNAASAMFVDAQAEASIRAWEEEYERQSKGYRTCELVGTFGSAEVHPEVQRIVEIHDAYACQPDSCKLA